MNPNTAKKRESAPAQATRPTPNFDTLKVSESLKKAEFGEKQAVTLVEIIQDAQAELATKVDLERTEFALRGDMEKMRLALRGDMEKMETGIRRDMEAGFHGLEKMVLNLRVDTEAGFRRVEAGSQRIAWLLMSAIVAATGVISAVILYLYGGA